MCSIILTKFLLFILYAIIDQSDTARKEPIKNMCHQKELIELV